MVRNGDFVARHRKKIVMCYLNRRFYNFTLCVLARQTLKYILTLILFVAML